MELGRKKEDTHRWTVGEYADLTARQTLDEVRGRKYLPQCYTERQGVDDALLAALEQPGAAVLVLGEAGSGKSSLLARLVESLLERGDHAAPAGKRRGSEVERYLATRGAGHVVVFLQGRQAYAGAAGAHPAAALCDAVLVRLSVCPGEFADLGALLAQLGATAGRDSEGQRRVILVLDALNEADTFTDLMKALDQALPHVARHPWARLVVSLRQGPWASLVAAHRRLGQTGASPLEHARHLCRFQDPERGEEHEALVLRPFTPEEGARAFAARRERLPERSARLGWECLGPELQHLLRSPLAAPPAPVPRDVPRAGRGAACGRGALPLRRLPGRAGGGAPGPRPLNNLGNLARDAGRSDEARDFFQEQLDVMRRLVQREPHRADFQRDLSVPLNNLGQLVRAAGRSDEAYDFFQESLDVRRRLVQREPHRADLRVDLALSC